MSDEPIGHIPATDRPREIADLVRELAEAPSLGAELLPKVEELFVKLREAGSRSEGLLRYRATLERMGVADQSTAVVPSFAYSIRSD